ncbi:hypothetical protein ERX46_15460 [Brumimicrobium glaciale]|uniref:Putative auto-transporter adhesin head GIN domain-containing protein n=1 Tax=Brumimicrobium glaciale TaxID=200475 RepID=A0A4Q4KGY6_9FLAO|nr:DUF2807 domain-containing protein [Brumimicrobium glaciale]RYM32078.1 hypothetical protein ERX46_15460 [Brumimicrobium glaciale]
MKFLLAVFSSIILFSSALSQEVTAFELSNFEKLVVIGNFPIEIFTSDRKEAIVDKEKTEANLDNLSFSYSQKTLTIKYSGSFVEEIGIELTLYHPGLISSIEARRGAQIKVKDAGNFTSTVSYKADSGGKFVIDKVYAPLIKAEVTKGGSISINGETPIFEPTVKTGGTIASVRLITQEVNASIIFGGEIICAPIETLTANVTSGGTISYTGNPKVTQKITLGGTIEKI